MAPRTSGSGATLPATATRSSSVCSFSALNILGIWDGHDSGAALLQDGRVRFAINEERLSRRKLEIVFPARSIDACLTYAGLGPGQIHVVAATTCDPAKTLGRVWTGSKERYYA